MRAWHEVGDRLASLLRGPRGAGLTVSAGLAAAAWVLWTRPLLDGADPRLGVELPWWGFALVVAACELVVLHVQVRREAHAISLSELAIVIGLFFTAPAAFLLGRLAGGLAVFVLRRRQAPVKVLFNTCLYAAESCLALVVFHGVRGDELHIDPSAWVAAGAATAAVGATAAVAVSAVIGLVEGTVDTGDVVGEIGRGALGSLAVTTVALVAAHAVAAEPLAAVPLTAALGLLLLGYRAYSGLSERHLSLERLYRFSHVVSSTPEVDEILHGVLQHAREVLRSEVAEVVFVASDPEHPPVRVDTDGHGALRRRRLTEDEARDPVWRRVVEGGAPLLLPRATREPAMRAYLASRGLPDAVLAPLRGDAGIVGTILVGDRMGDVRTFDQDDVQLLETVANHAGTALQNGRLADRLRHDALHDALTGLPNRVQLGRVLADCCADVRAHRTSGFSLLLLNLVAFKQVNDTLGHALGDQVLHEVGARLAQVVGDEGTVARLDGDEFGVLLPSTTLAQEALAAGRRLQSVLELPVDIDGLDVDVAAVVGVCVSPEHGLDGSVLLKRADAAMDEARRTGSGVHLYEPRLETSVSPERLRLVAELRSGIQDGELEVHVQPKAVAGSGQVVGCEALVRWRHPRHGLLFPDEFIPLAERTGLVRPLTTVVLAESLAACGAWRRAGHDLTIAVNLSARGILDAELTETVAMLLDLHRLPPSALTLEITESSIISDPRRTREVLDRLHAMGVRLSIDDFGTGYSSLSYLRQLPVQEVKVDKSFVMTMHHEPDDATIVRSIVELGRSLGLSVVAEGVEDADTWADLEDLGCHLVQGYFLARPMPVADFPAWLATREGHPCRLP